MRLTLETWWYCGLLVTLSYNLWGDRDFCEDGDDISLIWQFLSEPENIEMSLKSFLKTLKCPWKWSWVSLIPLLRGWQLCRKCSKTSILDKSLKNSNLWLPLHPRVQWVNSSGWYPFPCWLLIAGSITVTDPCYQAVCGRHREEEASEKTQVASSRIDQLLGCRHQSETQQTFSTCGH